MNNKIRILFISGCPGDTRLFRCFHLIELLNQNGFTADIVYFEDTPEINLIDSYNFIILHRMPYCLYTLTLLKRAGQKQIKIIFEIDDPIFDYTAVSKMTADNRNKIFTGEFEFFDTNTIVNRSGRILEYSDAIITSTRGMSDLLLKKGFSSYIIPNFLSDAEITICQSFKNISVNDNCKPNIIFVSGSNTHNLDIDSINEVLIWVNKRYPELEFTVIGEAEINPELKNAFKEKLIHYPFLNKNEFIQVLGKSDINLIPFQDNIFNSCKSIVRFLWASAAGCASIASSVGEYSYALEHEKNILLCNSEDEWKKNIQILIENRTLRKKIADDAYEFVIEKSNSIQKNAIDILKNIIDILNKKNIDSNKILLPEQEIETQQKQLNYYYSKNQLLIKQLNDLKKSDSEKAKSIEQHISIIRNLESELAKISDENKRLKKISDDLSVQNNEYIQRLAYSETFVARAKNTLFYKIYNLFRYKFKNHISSFKNYFTQFNKKKIILYSEFSRIIFKNLFLKLVITLKPNIKDYFPANSLTQSDKIKLLFITNNLNFEGAPISLYSLIKGLDKKSEFDITVLSHQQGPLSEKYQKLSDIRLIIRNPFNWDNIYNQKKNFDNFIEWINQNNFNLVICNTLNTFWGIFAAYKSGIPSMWIIRESVKYWNYFQSLNTFLDCRGISCFDYAHKTVFVCKSTAHIYRLMENPNKKFEIIYNGINLKSIDSYINNNNRESLRKKNNLNPADKAVLITGTVCERKGQKYFVEAAVKLLNKGLNNIKFFIVGCRESFYLNNIKKIPSEYNDKIIFVPETENVFEYYLISDIFVCSSLSESFPRVILESMAFTKAIITTDVNGIPEAVRNNIECLYTEKKSAADIADKIFFLIKNPDIEEKISANARKRVEHEFSHNKMVDKYYILIKNLIQGKNI